MSRPTNSLTTKRFRCNPREGDALSQPVLCRNLFLSMISTQIFVTHSICSAVSASASPQSSSAACSTRHLKNTILPAMHSSTHTQNNPLLRTMTSSLVSAMLACAFSIVVLLAISFSMGYISDIFGCTHVLIIGEQKALRPDSRSDSHSSGSAEPSSQPLRTRVKEFKRIGELRRLFLGFTQRFIEMEQEGFTSRVKAHCVNRTGPLSPCRQARALGFPAQDFLPILAPGEPLTNLLNGVATPLAQLPVTLAGNRTRLYSHVAALSNNTCAVVGGSTDLLKQPMGHAIDSNDAVIRLNLAPALHYSAHAGLRRTIEFASSTSIAVQWADWLLRRNDMESQFAEPFGNVSVMAGTDENAAMIYETKAYYHHVSPDIGLLMLGPAVRLLAARVYCHLANDGWIWPRHAEEIFFEPSPEFLAVVFALVSCREVSLYGFPSELRNDWQALFTQHYFDKPSPLTGAEPGGNSWQSLERYFLHHVIAEGLVEFH
eukprot:TRINITY_DN20253_c0_g1_i1.p1 TRINITY_DN20253_c0_g1~~TRINITY_DN20253_c0_g1_i1.p1  ORF type:complete len:488 (-),score=43.11 TRINITY_DN20253_c0_g1_i1:1017-2480(-)